MKLLVQWLYDYFCYLEFILCKDIFVCDFLVFNFVVCKGKVFLVFDEYVLIKDEQIDYSCKLF